MSEIRLKNKTGLTAAATGKIKIYSDSTTKQLASIDENGAVSLYGANINDPKVITVAKAGGEYLTLSEALGSIEDASETNPYIVKIGPGVFTEGVLVVPDYVSIKGDSINSTIIAADGNPNNLFEMGHHTSISFMSLKNVPSGYAAITMTDSLNDDAWFVAHKISLFNCSIGCYINTSTNSKQAYLEYVDMNEEYIHAVKVETTNNFYAFINLENFYTYPTGTANMAELHIEGLDAEAELLACGIQGNANNTGVYVTDGGLVGMKATTIVNCNIGIHSDSTGTGSNILVSATSFSDCTKNISIENSSTTGSFTGYTEYTKTEIDESSSFFLTGKDTKKITVRKKDGDFSSIYDALATITDNSSTNRYIIDVGPGIFTEQQLNIPEYVSVVGSSINNTLVYPSGNHDVFYLENSTAEISFLSIYSATTNYAGVRVKDCGDFCQLHKVSIYDCYIGIDLLSTTADSYFYCEYVDISGEFTRAINVTSENGYIAYCSLENFYTIPTGTIVEGTQIYIKGTESEVVIPSMALYGRGDDIGIHIEDGSMLNIRACSIDGCGTAVFAENVGDGCDLLLQASVLNSTTYDINVAHPSTTGSITGSADSSKVFINTSSTISMSYSDPDIGHIVLNDLYQGSRHDRLVNISQLTRLTATTGHSYGGELTAATGTSLDVDIASGYGFLGVSDSTPVGHYLKEINWDADTITLPANSESYIYIDSSGVVTSATSAPNSLYSILLGNAFTNADDIVFIANVPRTMHHTSNLFENALRDALGPIFGTGCILSENGTRKLNMTSGSFYYGSKNINPSSLTAPTFITYYQDGSTGYTAGSSDTIDNTYYDDGSGTLAAMTTDYYAKHSIYLNGSESTSELFFVYSQVEYDSLVNAQAGDIPTPPSWLSKSITLIATIIVKKSATNLEEIRDERPKIGFSPSAITALTSHGNLSGLTTGDAGHTQFLMLDGSKSMTSDLNMGTNNINNVGTVDGVTVSAHASRHLPTGSDALTTAAPATNLSATTTNATGNANSLARSNHTHAVETGVVSSQTPDQTNAEGSSANLARADHAHNIAAAAPSSIGTTNSKGSNASFSLSDHIHNHGDQTTPTHHAIATTTDNGFMSATDKVILDTININKILSSSESSNSTSYIATSGLTTASLASGTYVFTTTIVAQQSSSTSYGIGLRMQVGTATMSSCFAKWLLAYGANGYDQSYIYDQVSPTQNTVGARYPSVNTDQVNTGSGTFTLTNAGTVTIGFRSESTSGTVTLVAGSILSIKKVA